MRKVTEKIKWRKHECTIVCVYVWAQVVGADVVVVGDDDDDGGGGNSGANREDWRLWQRVARGAIDVFRSVYDGGGNYGGMMPLI